MNVQELWQHSRTIDGTCGLCAAPLKPGDDFRICDDCWPDDDGED